MTRHRLPSYLRLSAATGLAVAVTLLAAGCDREPQAADPTPTATPTVEATEAGRTTATEPTTSEPTKVPTEQPTLTPPNDPEPELATTGDDLEGVVHSLYAYRSWLFLHPDPDNTDRLDRIVDPECNCWEADHALLAHYAEQQLWWTGAVLLPVSVEDLDRSAQNAAIVGVVYERDGTAQLVDRTGAVHDELEPRRFYGEDVLVREDASSPWRLLSTSEARPVPGEESEDGEG